MRALALVALLFGVGCSCSSSGLLVDVRTNLVPGVEFDSIRTEAIPRGPARSSAVTRPIAFGDRIDRGIRVAELGVAPDVYEVHVTLVDHGNDVVERRAFIQVQSLERLSLLITRDCAAIRCQDDETCVSGRCVEIDCGTPGQSECPTVQCTGNRECMASAECSRAECVEGSCVLFGDHERCGADQYCDVDMGCMPLTLPTDAGTSPDSGPPPVCPAAGCNDNNPCTDDTCVAGVCAFMPNSAQCDDSLFCNGSPDICQGGACTMHPGDPCPSAGCDEAGDTCVCRNDADCPARVDGAWSPCGGFANGCTLDGSQSRSVTTYTCTGGSCMPRVTNEVQGCMRPSTDGIACGDPGCSDWSGCRYSSDCAETGEQTRTCTDYACSGGTCISRNVVESMPCRRMTGGWMCDPSSCTGWSGCDYADECDQNAQRTRRCTDYTCMDGRCSGSSYTDVDNDYCTRDTTDSLCGSNPTICGQPTDCHICRGGSCVVNMPHYNESCEPSCGVAIGLCGGPGICCPEGGFCPTIGGLGSADCGMCCEGSFCY